MEENKEINDIKKKKGISFNKLIVIILLALLALVAILSSISAVANYMSVKTKDAEDIMVTLVTLSIACLALETAGIIVYLNVSKRRKKIAERLAAGETMEEIEAKAKKPKKVKTKAKAESGNDEDSPVNQEISAKASETKES